MYSLGSTCFPKHNQLAAPLGAKKKMNYDIKIESPLSQTEMWALSPKVTKKNS